MLQRKLKNRLGSKQGSQEVKSHPWLADFRWKDLSNKKLKAPFVPGDHDNFDERNINEGWLDKEDEDFLENEKSLHRMSI